MPSNSAGWISKPWIPITLSPTLKTWFNSASPHVIRRINVHGSLLGWFHYNSLKSRFFVLSIIVISDSLQSFFNHLTVVSLTFRHRYQIWRYSFEYFNHILLLEESLWGSLIHSILSFFLPSSITLYSAFMFNTFKVYNILPSVIPTYCDLRIFNRNMSAIDLDGFSY